MIKLTKNQKEVALGRVLCALILENNLTLSESIEKSMDNSLIEAYAIFKKVNSNCREKGIKGKEKGAVILNKISEIEDLKVKKAYSKLTDAYQVKNIRQDFYQVGYVEYDVIDNKNVYTYGIKSYFNSGVMFNQTTLGIFHTEKNIDKVTLKNSIDTLTPRQEALIEKISNQFNENKKQYDSLEQVLNQVTEVISEKSTAKANVRELVNKYTK